MIFVDDYTPAHEAAPLNRQEAVAVRDSLIDAFDFSHPVHVRGEPYVGGYSHIILRDGDDTVKTKNKAFVTKLIDLFSATRDECRLG